MPAATAYGKPASLLILDIDHFKGINGSHGYLVGAAVLIEVAAILRTDTRTSDCVARWSGEEFAALVPETDGAEAARADDKIRVAAEDNPSSCAMPVTLSVDIAEFHPEVDSLDDLIRPADNDGEGAISRGGFNSRPQAVRPSWKASSFASASASVTADAVALRRAVGSDERRRLAPQ